MKGKQRATQVEAYSMVVMIYKKGASLTACCWEVSTKKHNNQDIAESAGRDVHTSGKLYRYNSVEINETTNMSFYSNQQKIIKLHAMDAHFSKLQ